MSPKLILLAGPDRVGKTTMAQSLATKNSKILHFQAPQSLDEDLFYKYTPLFREAIMPHDIVIADRNFYEAGFYERFRRNLRINRKVELDGILQMERNLHQLYVAPTVYLLCFNWNDTIEQLHQDELAEFNIYPGSYLFDAHMDMRRREHYTYYAHINHISSYSTFNWEVKYVTR